MTGPTRRALIRTASLLPLAGCNSLEDLFESDKPLIPGKREAVMAGGRGLQVDPALTTPVSFPPPVLNADWPQAGGDAAHAIGNVQIGAIQRSWRRSIGEGGGYRQRITAAPVVAGGQVFTMDSDGSVSAFDAASGSRRWNTDTQGEKDRSTNIGGGLATDGQLVFASTGRGELMTLDARTGKIGWRSPLDAPARSAPTLAAGRLYLTTLDERLLCFTPADGKRQWSFNATVVATSVLGAPAPAYSDGIVVGGFGSGDLVALRAESGTLVWSDSLAAARGRNSLTDLSALRALPVIAGNLVYAISVGNLLVAIDLRSGRRIWEREASGQHTPVVAGDWLFVLTQDQLLACLNRQDGHVRWLTRLARYEDPVKSRDPIFWAGPILAGNMLYVGSSTEKLLAVRADTGVPLGDVSLPGALSVAMVAAGGKLFVTTDDGSLTAYG